MFPGGTQETFSPEQGRFLFIIKKDPDMMK